MDALRTRRCECGAEDCTATLQMSWAEQDAVDHAAGHWALAPGHELRGADRTTIVARNERFVVVHAVELHDNAE